MPYATPVASAARTASGDSGPLTGLANANFLRVMLSVTAASGTTPTLDVRFSDTLDGGASWNTLASFTQATAPGSQVVNYTGPFSDTLRVSWVIGGVTPSFTFSVVWYTEP